MTQQVVAADCHHQAAAELVRSAAEGRSGRTPRDARAAMRFDWDFGDEILRQPRAGDVSRRTFFREHLRSRKSWPTPL
jgi:hypothetical protein